MTAPPQVRPFSAQEQEFADAMRDPPTFARKILRHNLWPVQERILDAVATHDRVAVKACHSSSKTFSAAELVLWWITRYRDGIAITTGPGGRQIKRVMWGEIHKAISTSLIHYPAKLNSVDLVLSPENYALGFSTDDEISFHGYKGRILVVIDEAQGVDGATMEAIEGMRAGGQVHLLMIGNPTIASGPFYDAFTNSRTEWTCVTISAFDTPNLRGWCLDDGEGYRVGDPRPEARNLLTASAAQLAAAVTHPFLALPSWVVDRWRKWGKNSPLWASRVLGAFPRQSEDALLSLDWIEQSRYRTLVVDPDAPFTAGLDVGGGGTGETVLEVRQGPKTVHRKTWSDPDTRGAVVLELAPYRDRLEAINVDADGIGHNFGLHLRDQGLPVNLIHVGLPSDDRERFFNLKAQYYWGLHDRYEAGDMQDTDMDETTLAQLAGIRWRPTPRGQIKIESKLELKARGVDSPDRAEAKMLCYAGGTSWKVW